MWWFLACTADDPVPPPTTVTVSECPDPQPLRWVPDAPIQNFGSLAAGDRVDQGGIALIPTADGPILAWTDPAGRLSFTDLGAGRNLQDWQDTPPVHAFSLGDLDGSGTLDLVFIGDQSGIFWDFPGTFPDITWLPPTQGLRDLTVGDVDGDGHPDLLGSYSLPSGPTPAASLFRGQGDRLFAAAEALPGEIWGRNFDTSLVNLSGDFHPEALFCNDMGRAVAPNALYQNENGQLLPGDDPAGLDVAADCMGSTWGDLNGDGQLDFAMGDAERLWLLQRDEEGFVDVTATSGLPELDPHQMLWGLAIEDLNNDGRNDLLLPTSWFRDGTEGPWPVRIGIQQPVGNFSEDGAALGMPLAAHTRTVVAYDLNADGVLDLLFGDANRSPWIYRSAGCTAENWLEVEAPPGTRVRVQTPEGDRIGLATTDASFASARPPRLHFGLGDTSQIERIFFTLESGEEYTFEDPVSARSVIHWQP